MMVLLLLTSCSWVRCADTQETDIESMLFFKALYPLQNEIAEEPVSGIVGKGFFLFFFFFLLIHTEYPLITSFSTITGKSGMLRSFQKKVSAVKQTGLYLT